MEDFGITEFIYIVQPREFIRMKENVYKIGRTAQSPDKRIGQYPKNTKLYFIIAVDNSIEKETMLLRIFRKEFIPRTDFGSEYFEGDVNDMISTIVDNLRPKPNYHKCDSCKLSITSNIVGSVFCCGIFHNACLNRELIPRCPLCNSCYSAQRLYISHPVLLSMFTQSKHSSIVGSIEESNICAVYGDKYDVGSMTSIIECLMSGKPTFLFINPEHSPLERAYFTDIARLCVESIPRYMPMIYTYLCFQPKDVRFVSNSVQDTLLSIAYSCASEWRHVLHAEQIRPEPSPPIPIIDISMYSDEQMSVVTV